MSNMIRISVCFCLLIAAMASSGMAQDEAVRPGSYVSPYDTKLFPPQISGPYISRTDVLLKLDNVDPEALSFDSLMRKIIPKQQIKEAALNPFSPRVADGEGTEPISARIAKDIRKVAADHHAVGKEILDPEFLTYQGGFVELVGVIARFDRNFITDHAGARSRGRQAVQKCGELSLLYRFGYATTAGPSPAAFASRLPATINLVFPMIPFTVPRGASIPTCREMANRWLSTVQDLQRLTLKANLNDADISDFVRNVRGDRRGALAFVTGEDLLRMEFNIQAFRVLASRDSADAERTQFGTRSGYILRVFKWNASGQYFDVAPLRNQLKRSLFSCADPPCEAKAKLLAWLNQKFEDGSDQIEAIDRGTFELPESLLERRSVSISPGGMHRSGNQPFWKSDNPSQDILTDKEIQAALDKHDSNRAPLSFIKSPEDVRVRLNEGSCTGCHQTRAIAGFHFPGADRPGTPRANSVLLPGSAHFYADQPRRMAILKAIAAGRTPDYRTHYAARPKSNFAEPPKNADDQTLFGTQLVNGWGAACLTDEGQKNSRRKWGCMEPLTCRQVFISKNDPGAGICLPQLPDGWPSVAVQVGDPTQTGSVESFAFGKDCYMRSAPNAVIDPELKTECKLKDNAETRILASQLPQYQRARNSYYGSHQEFYSNDPNPTSPYRDKLRDASTGGFPGGALRLSECSELPSEATCGMIASSGFNDCLSRASETNDITLLDCYRYFTSYAGLRACDAAAPCRDDYICVKPIKDSEEPLSFKEIFKQRRDRLKADAKRGSQSNYYTIRKITPQKAYVASDHYGQTDPDDVWVAKNDQRGLCIPPYFVLQFKADGHKLPANADR